MIARHGDWIIRGVNGEFYPCKPDVFQKTYDFVEDGEPLTLSKGVMYTFSGIACQAYHGPGTDIAITGTSLLEGYYETLADGLNFKETK
jgi:hypothetical protein